MEIEYIEGDLFAGLDNIPSDTVVYIPHIVNNKGAWGAGFVIPLGRTFPAAREAYQRAMVNGMTYEDGLPYSSKFQLGVSQFVKVKEDPTIHVVNMMAQTLGGVRPLYYNHLSRCMEAVAKAAVDSPKSQIIAPLFGSGLAGGNWNFIQCLIEDIWLRNNIKATIYYLPGTFERNE